jgi:hypothetical protein
MTITYAKRFIGSDDGYTLKFIKKDGGGVQKCIMSYEFDIVDFDEDVEKICKTITDKIQKSQRMYVSRLLNNMGSKCLVVL